MSISGNNNVNIVKDTSTTALPSNICGSYTYTDASTNTLLDKYYETDKKDLPKLAQHDIIKIFKAAQHRKVEIDVDYLTVESEQRSYFLCHVVALGVILV